VGGSQRELVELGLYQGWLPPAVHRTMTAGSEMLTTTTASLGGLGLRGGLSTDARGAGSCRAGRPPGRATAVRQREVADLLAFTLLLGAGLSVLLALLVGRALARPIQTLQVASERVGSGNMGVHLPADRTDEFGAVFEAFNRMVDRLARTRRALVRSSRRTRAIVEEVATGVIAVDAQGRVTLANPRAEALLGIRLPRSQPFARWGWTGRAMRDLARWVTEVPPRRRGRGRPSSRSTDAGSGSGLGGSPGEAPSGAVIALEDVTDELRTERILAWGEMAQQVAHEVKNPLTPIKLGIQHIRRAWVDRSPDYDEILERNVTAILAEIDRLAAISSSFSRFGAPGPPTMDRWAPVEWTSVITRSWRSTRPERDRCGSRRRSIPGLRRAGATDELKEVLVNLLENARAALPRGRDRGVEGRRPTRTGCSVRVGTTVRGFRPD
jgi:two-component system, NtrC family, nitrogen regulation sensor histidine kinase NtrY